MFTHGEMDAPWKNGNLLHKMNLVSRVDTGASQKRSGCGTTRFTHHVPMYHVNMSISFYKRYTNECLSAARYRSIAEANANRGSRATPTSPIKTGSTAAPASARL